MRRILLSFFVDISVPIEIQIGKNYFLLTAVALVKLGRVA